MSSTRPCGCRSPWPAGRSDPRRRGIGYGRGVTIVNPLSAGERRVIGCLIEKAATTPDSYPLTTNSLRLACNQSTNRNPVVDFSEREVDALMLELRQRGLARTVSGSGHRVGKHRHIVDEAMGLSGPELAILAPMLLRGPQTVAELVSRTARYSDGPEGVAGVESAIDSLVSRDEPLVVRLARRSGEREPRVAQVWSLVDDEPGSVAPVADPLPADPLPADTSPPFSDRAVSTARESAAPNAASPIAQPSMHAMAARIDALERSLAEQTKRLDRLASELGY